MWDKAEPGKGYDLKAEQWFDDMLQELYHPWTVKAKEK
jgi:hypothetical protein